MDTLPGPSLYDGGMIVDGGSIDANYRDIVLYRGQNGTRLAFDCAAIATTSIVWGTDVYTDDSSVCVAAIHARAIPSGGGPVVVEVRPGRSCYLGSTRNGVTTSNYGPWSGSFTVVP